MWFWSSNQHAIESRFESRGDWLRLHRQEDQLLWGLWFGVQSRHVTAESRAESRSTSIVHVYTHTHKPFQIMHQACSALPSPVNFCPLGQIHLYHWRKKLPSCIGRMLSPLRSSPWSIWLRGRRRNGQTLRSANNMTFGELMKLAKAFVRRWSKGRTFLGNGRCISRLLRCLRRLGRPCHPQSQQTMPFQTIWQLLGLIPFTTWCLYAYIHTYRHTCIYNPCLQPVNWLITGVCTSWIGWQVGCFLLLITRKNEFPLVIKHG